MQYRCSDPNSFFNPQEKAPRRVPQFLDDFRSYLLALLLKCISLVNIFLKLNDINFCRAERNDFNLHFSQSFKYLFISFKRSTIKEVSLCQHQARLLSSLHLSYPWRLSRLLHGFVEQLES
jgi:hypothetical protein